MHSSLNILVILFLKWYIPNQKNIYCVCCIWGERSKAALETLDPEGPEFE